MDATEHQKDQPSQITPKFFLTPRDVSNEKESVGGAQSYLNERVKVRISTTPPPIHSKLEKGSEEENKENAIEKGRKWCNLPVKHVKESFVCHTSHQVKNDVPFVGSLHRMVCTVICHHLYKVIKGVPKFGAIKSKHQLLVGCLPTDKPEGEQNQQKVGFTKQTIHRCRIQAV